MSRIKKTFGLPFEEILSYAEQLTIQEQSELAAKLQILIWEKIKIMDETKNMVLETLKNGQ